MAHQLLPTTYGFDEVQGIWVSLHDLAMQLLMDPYDLWKSFFSPTTEVVYIVDDSLGKGKLFALHVDGSQYGTPDPKVFLFGYQNVFETVIKENPSIYIHASFAKQVLDSNTERLTYLRELRENTYHRLYVSARGKFDRAFISLCKNKFDMSAEGAKAHYDLLASVPIGYTYYGKFTMDYAQRTFGPDSQYNILAGLCCKDEQGRPYTETHVVVVKKI